MHGRQASMRDRSHVDQSPAASRTPVVAQHPALAGHMLRRMPAPSIPSVRTGPARSRRPMRLSVLKCAYGHAACGCAWLLQARNTCVGARRSDRQRQQPAGPARRRLTQLGRRTAVKRGQRACRRTKAGQGAERQKSGVRAACARQRAARGAALTGLFRFSSSLPHCSGARSACSASGRPAAANDRLPGAQRGVVLRRSAPPVPRCKCPAPARRC